MINGAQVLKFKIFQSQYIFLKTLEVVNMRLFNLFQASSPLNESK